MESVFGEYDQLRGRKGRADRAYRAAYAVHDGDAANPRDLELAELAESMGYVPNPNAASLTTRRSMAFGVLVPRLTDTVLATVYDALEETANRAGYATFVSNTHDDPGEQRRL